MPAAKGSARIPFGPKKQKINNFSFILKTIQKICRHVKTLLERPKSEKHCARCVHITTCCCLYFVVSWYNLILCSCFLFVLFVLFALGNVRLHSTYISSSRVWSFSQSAFEMRVKCMPYDLLFQQVIFCLEFITILLETVLIFLY